MCVCGAQRVQRLSMQRGCSGGDGSVECRVKKAREEKEKMKAEVQKGTKTGVMVVELKLFIRLKKRKRSFFKLIKK